MAQRDSGYKRIKLDAYQTPEWVTMALVPHIPVQRGSRIWEPAAGKGLMVKVLRDANFKVIASDIKAGKNFLKTTRFHNADCITTNPPYSYAEEFIDHALTLMSVNGGAVCMLLNTDFDHAKTRRHLFADCRAFAKKLVLTKRIRWIKNSKGSPSANHAWFIWDYQHRGPHTIDYDFQ